MDDVTTIESEIKIELTDVYPVPRQHPLPIPEPVELSDETITLTDELEIKISETFELPTRGMGPVVPPDSEPEPEIDPLPIPEPTELAPET
jgi:hypothetical protein